MSEYIIRFHEDERGIVRSWDHVGKLIRCEDCKWFGKVGCAIWIKDDSDKPSENDYCSFAERQEDDN